MIYLSSYRFDCQPVLAFEPEELTSYSNSIALFALTALKYPTPLRKTLRNLLAGNLSEKIHLPLYKVIIKGSPFINRSVRPSISRSVCPAISRSVRPSISRSVRPSNSRSVRPSISRSVRLSISRSVGPSFLPSLIIRTAASRVAHRLPSFAR